MRRKSCITAHKSEKRGEKSSIFSIKTLLFGFLKNDYFKRQKLFPLSEEKEKKAKKNVPLSPTTNILR